MVSYDAVERSMTCFFGPPSEATFGSSKSRGQEREEGSAGIFRQLQPTLWTHNVHLEELVHCHHGNT